MERSARAIERRREADGLAAVRRHREKLDVAAVGVQPGAREKGDRTPVPRERREHDRPRGRGETLRRATLRRHAPEVARVVVVARGVTGRREHDRFAVGRPDRIGVDEVAVGDLNGARPVERDDEDVRAPIVREPLAVEPILHRGDDACRSRLALLLLALRLLLAADRRHEHEPGAVRRPRDARDPVLQGGQLRRLAAVRRHHVELELVLGGAFGKECQPRAVGRPLRLDVAPWPRGELPGRAAVDADDPDVGEILVALLGQGRDDEGDASSVGRDLGFGDEQNSRQIFGGHAAAGAHGCTDARRSASRASISPASAVAPSPSISPTTAARRRAIKRPSVWRQPSASRAFSH